MPGRLVPSLLVACLPLGGLAATSGPAAAATVPPINACYSSDNSAPVVSSVELSTDAVDVREAGRDVTVTVRFTEPGAPGTSSGFRDGYVEIAGYDQAPLALASDGVATATIAIGRNQSTGEHRLIEVTLEDAAGNTTRLTGADLDAVAPDRSVTVTGERDATAPVIRSVSVSRTRVDARGGARSVAVEARITDASDVASALVALSPGLEPASGDVSTVELRKEAGERYRGVIRVPRWGTQRSSVQQLISLEATDSAGNTAQRTGFWIRRQVGTDRLAIIQRVDTTAPVISDVSAAPRTIDLDQGPATITLRARIRDAQAPVEAVGVVTKYLTLYRAAGLPLSSRRGPEPRLVSGDRHDGVWEVSFEGNCRIPTSSFVVGGGGWSATNAADLLRRYNSRSNGITVTFTGTPTRNVAVRLDPVTAGSPLTVRFSHAVLNLTQASGRFTTQDGTELPGAWTTCFDGQDAVVDCLDGPVRRATYTPTGPVPAGTTVILRVNPDGVLDARDAQGVPVDTAPVVTYS